MKSTSQHWRKGLYLVSTPIGNLADISFRAVEALKHVDAIFCEDTRVTRKLCQYYNIKTPLFPYHDHSSDKDRNAIIERLKNGDNLALVSDAGTPMISDPGYKLVQLCEAENIDVLPISGANAVLPALQMSALPTDCFCFAGFLPNKTKARQDKLFTFKDYASTLVFYESVPRLKACLKDVLSVLGDRKMAVVREISKMHEEAIRGNVSEILDILESDKTVRGELVLVIQGAAEQEQSAEETEKSTQDALKDAMEAMSLKDAVALVTKQTRLSKKEVYALALELQKQ